MVIGQHVALAPVFVAHDEAEVAAVQSLLGAEDAAVEDRRQRPMANDERACGTIRTSQRSEGGKDEACYVFGVIEETTNVYSVMRIQTNALRVHSS